MDSDSESQDSDEGRRFRLETTRKDAPRRREQLSPSTRSNNSNNSSTSSRRRSRSRSHSRRRRSSSADNNSSSTTSRQQQQHSRRHREEPRDSSRNGRHKSKREKHKRRERRDSPVLESERREEKRREQPAELKPPLEEKVKRQQLQRPQQPAEERSSGGGNPAVAVVSDVGMPPVVASGLRPTGPPNPQSKKRPPSYFERVVNRAGASSSGLLDGDEAAYGPALPPQLEKRLFEARRADNLEPLGGRQEVGPVLPPALQTQEEESRVDKVDQEEEPDEEKMEQVEEEEEEVEAFGPALPPHLERRKVVGPMLPANFVPTEAVDDPVQVDKSPENEDKDEDEDEDDDEVVGPLPADHPAAKASRVQMQLEHRAKLVKEKLRDKTSPEKNKREEWMVELPPVHAVALGLESIKRKFKTTEGPDLSDRSVWTDTPADRLRKEKEKEENRFVKSEESSKKAKKSIPKEPVEEEQRESLLDMHLKTMKKKKKKMEKEAKELGLSTRRPFDRDIDLQVNRLDEAKKKKIFDKARLLNDRFTSGRI